MGGKQICCCVSSQWTYTIGWLQIITSLVFSLIIFARLHYLLDRRSSIANQFWLTDGEKDDRVQTNEVLIVLTSIMIGLTSLSLLMGIVLLVGAAKRNTCLIQAWMVHTVLALIFEVILGLIESITSDTFFLFTITTVIGLSISLFFLWVVRTHLNSIKARTPALVDILL